MAKIWEFFENMNEMVYVSDMDSHEMIYMNRKTLKMYGYESLEEVVGRKCYEVLQGGSVPCAMCSNRELREGYFKEWEYYSPVLHRHMKLKDTMVVDDGRRCRMEIAVDNSLQVRQNNMINNYQNMEMLANEALRVALKAPTPDLCIGIILEYLGKTLQGERTYIFERNENGNDDNTYEWVAKGIAPEKAKLQNIPAEVCANWYKRFNVNEHIVISDLEDIREEDVSWYEKLKRQGLRSLVVVPLYDDSTAIGFYGVDNLPPEIVEYASDMLQIMGHFIISSLKSRNLVRQLKTMSHYDQLTRLGNRYAMNEYLTGLRRGESLGVVYGDITGLKRVNDTEGHEAGDRLITRVCDCLRKVFGDYGLFRVGGDELLALCVGIGEDELKERVLRLKEDMQEQDIVMAVGTAWQEDGAVNTEEMLNVAERRMYEEKAAYYKASGIERRR